MLWAASIWILFWIGAASQLLLIFVLGVVFVVSMVYLINNDNDEGELLVKWFLSILLSVVAVSLLGGFVAGLVVLAILFPVQVVVVVGSLAFIALVWLASVNIHTWLLDRAYLRRKRKAARVARELDHEAALVEEAERAGLLRAER